MWLSVVVRCVKLSWYIFLANLSSALSFRLSFCLHVLGVVLWYGGQFFLWSVFFTQFPLVGGWTTKDLILVYSLFVFSVSLLDVFAGGICELARIINAGSLDYFLVFPKSVLWHVAVSRSDVTSLGPVALSIGFFLLSAPVNALRLLLFLVASVFSMILIFNFFVITQSVAFFVGGFDLGASAIRHLLAIVSPYPFKIFPSPFKYILMTLVPSFFVVTLPSQLVDHFSFNNLALLILVSIVSSYLSHKVFNAGLRHYESGSMINVRL